MTSAIAAHAAAFHGGVLYTVVTATILATVGIRNIPLPQAVLADKVVSLSAVAKFFGGGGDELMYRPPWGMNSWMPGTEYVIYVSSASGLILRTISSTASSRVLGAEVRIVIGYLP